MQSIFSPYCSCQGAFEIPFLMRAGIPPSFSISSGGEAGRVSDRRMTAVKVPQSGKVFCSRLIEKSYFGGSRFVFINNVIWLRGGGQPDLHLQRRYLIWHRWLFLRGSDRPCWWRWILATFKGPVITRDSFVLSNYAREVLFSLYILTSQPWPHPQAHCLLLMI